VCHWQRVRASSSLPGRTIPELFPQPCYRRSPPYPGTCFAENKIYPPTPDTRSKPSDFGKRSRRVVPFHEVDENTSGRRMRDENRFRIKRTSDDATARAQRSLQTVGFVRPHSVLVKTDCERLPGHRGILYGERYSRTRANGLRFSNKRVSHQADNSEIERRRRSIRFARGIII